MPVRRPRALKLLDGQPPSEVNHEEPQPIAEEPRMPGWFNLTQTQTWRHTVRQLRGMRMLSAADYDTIVNYCVTADLCHRIGAELDTTDLTITGGHGSSYSHPMLATLNAAQNRLIRLARELGLTPASRASLRMSS